MRRLMNLNLWGKGASAEDQPKEETEEEKAAREQSEKEAADKKAAEDEEAAAAAAASDEDDEDEEDEEDDEATKAAAAAVPAKVRASIVRAERTRIHAIVNGGGPARVATSLKLALGTNLSPKAALAIVTTTASAEPSGGRLRLQEEMSGRRPQPLGPAASAATSDVDKMAAGIAAFAARPGAERD